MHHLLHQYLDHCARRNLRPLYIEHQRWALERLERWLDQHGLDLLHATNDDLTRYLDQRGLQPGSRAVEIAYLRGFYGWALDEGLIADSPARRLVRPRLAPRLPRPMPDEEVARALAEAPCDVAPILHLAVYAGLRACEIAQLRAEDVDYQRGIIRIRESKGGGESTVPIAPLLASTLERCPLPERGWLFPSRRGGHVSRSRISQIANRYLHSIGIDHTLHTLRHTYGTAIYQATRDLRLTQELMRHRSIQSTVGYTRLAADAGADALAGLRW